jgi:ATP-binding cassette, subfamily B, bacterial MsbA
MPSDTSLYRRLLRYVKPYRGIFAIAIVALLCEAMVQPMLALIFERLIDGGFSGAAAKAMPQASALGGIAPIAWMQARLREMPIGWLPAFVVVMFAVRGLMSFMGDYLMHWVGNKVVMDLRTDAFAHMTRLPAQAYDTQPTGTMTSKLTFDCAQVGQASTQALTSLVQDSAVLIAMLITMWHFSPRLTLISFAVAPAVGIVISVVSKRLKRATRGIQTAMGELTTTADEAIVGQRVVKAFGGQDIERNAFTRAANHLRQFQMKEAAANDATVPVMHIFVSIAIAVVVGLAIEAGQQGTLTAGGLMGFLTALMQTLSPLKKLTGVNAMIQRGLAASESVFAVIDAPKEIDTGTHSVARAKGELRFENVSLAYAADKPNALNDVSFTVNPGETVAFVGPSGGGKSSIVNLVPRFYIPSAGTIRIDNVPINAWQLGNLREQIAIVGQEVVLFNDTVAANIAYGGKAGATREAVEAAARAANAHEFIAAMPQGYDTSVGERGVALSGGQRQRIAIARAILKDAPILILDEATAALDNESERFVQAALTKLMQGRTTLVIAHRLSTVEQADRIFVLDGGRIVESGTHSALLSENGLYAKLSRMASVAP